MERGDCHWRAGKQQGQQSHCGGRHYVDFRQLINGIVLPEPISADYALEEYDSSQKIAMQVDFFLTFQLGGRFII